MSNPYRMKSHLDEQAVPVGYDGPMDRSRMDKWNDFLSSVTGRLQDFRWSMPRVRMYESPKRLWQSPVMWVIDSSWPEDAPRIRTDNVMGHEMSLVDGPYERLPKGHAQTCSYLHEAGNDLRKVACVWTLALTHQSRGGGTIHPASRLLRGFRVPEGMFEKGCLPSWHHLASPVQFTFWTLSRDEMEDMSLYDVATLVSTLAVLNSNAWNVVVVRNPKESPQPSQDPPADPR